MFDSNRLPFLVVTLFASLTISFPSTLYAAITEYYFRPESSSILYLSSSTTNNGVTFWTEYTYDDETGTQGSVSIYETEECTNIVSVAASVNAYLDLPPGPGQYLESIYEVQTPVDIKCFILTVLDSGNNPLSTLEVTSSNPIYSIRLAPSSTSSTSSSTSSTSMTDYDLLKFNIAVFSIIIVCAIATYKLLK